MAFSVVFPSSLQTLKVWYTGIFFHTTTYRHKLRTTLANNIVKETITVKQMQSRTTEKGTKKKKQTGKSPHVPFSPPLPSAAFSKIQYTSVHNKNQLFLDFRFFFFFLLQNKNIRTALAPYICVVLSPPTSSSNSPRRVYTRPATQ